MINIKKKYITINEFDYDDLELILF